MKDATLALTQRYFMRLVIVSAIGLLSALPAPGAGKWIPSPAQQEMCAQEKCVVIQEELLEMRIRAAARELVRANADRADPADCWQQPL